MSLQDPLSDLFSRIRNAQMRNKPIVSSPVSILRENILEVLKNEGYYTAIIGKWHLGTAPSYGPTDQGFDDSLQLMGGLYLPENHPDVVNARTGEIIDEMVWASTQYAARNNKSEPFEPRGYITDYYTDEAIKVIEKNKNRPFFLYLSHFAPHNPLQALRDDYDHFHHIEGESVSYTHLTLPTNREV